MELYDQHEQGERVRSWLKDNIPAIAIGIGLGLALIFGYHQWQNYSLRQAHVAAELYYRAQLAPEGSPAAQAAFEELRKDYSGSGYAQLAALAQAQQALADGDLDAARSHLDWALRTTKEAGLKSLLSLRLARLDMAQGQAEAALKRLDSMPPQDFIAERQELRGDALLALGRGEQALAAYRAAQEAGPSDPSRLEMKLAEFGASAQQAEAEA